MGILKRSIEAIVVALITVAILAAVFHYIGWSLNWGTVGGVIATSYYMAGSVNQGPRLISRKLERCNLCDGIEFPSD